MRLELEADDEEQEHDTELGERVDRFGLLDELESPRADRDAGEKVARDRAEPEAVRGHHRDHRGCEIDRRLQEKYVAVLHARSIVAAREGACEPSSSASTRASSRCSRVVRSFSGSACATARGCQITSIRRRSPASFSFSRSRSRRAWGSCNTTRCTTPLPPPSRRRCPRGRRRKSCCAARPSCVICTELHGHGPCGRGAMKPAQLGSLNAELPPLEEDLAARLESIFERCPQLHGFTIQDSSALPEELRSLALERELVVTDIGVYPFINAEQCEAIYNEIAVALLDFLYERPTAKDVLRGRTFVRTLH